MRQTLAQNGALVQEKARPYREVVLVQMYMYWKHVLY